MRNSGAISVIEGVGDHGCEYMTGGVCVILGSTGRNFAAGMSGGYAYVLNEDGKFMDRCNSEMVDLESVTETHEAHFLKSLIAEHVRLTGSEIGKRVLLNWIDILPKFVKVFPQDLKLIMSTESARRLEVTKEVDVPAPSPQVATMMDIEDAMEDIMTEKIKPVQEVDKLRGFMKYQRESDKYRDPLKRSKDWKEVNSRLGKSELKVQASRCMV